MSGGHDDRSVRGLGRSYRPSVVHSHTLPGGELSVDCWCRRAIVYVAPEVVWERRTESCGRSGCEEPPAITTDV